MPPAACELAAGLAGAAAAGWARAESARPGTVRSPVRDGRPVRLSRKVQAAYIGVRFLK